MNNIGKTTGDVLGKIGAFARQVGDETMMDTLSGIRSVGNYATGLQKQYGSATPLMFTDPLKYAKTIAGGIVSGVGKGYGLATTPITPKWAQPAQRWAEKQSLNPLIGPLGRLLPTVTPKTLINAELPGVKQIEGMPTIARQAIGPITQVPAMAQAITRQVGRYAGLQPSPLDVALLPGYAKLLRGAAPTPEDFAQNRQRVSESVGRRFGEADFVQHKGFTAEKVGNTWEFTSPKGNVVRRVQGLDQIAKTPEQIKNYIDQIVEPSVYGPTGGAGGAGMAGDLADNYFSQERGGINISDEADRQALAELNAEKPSMTMKDFGQEGSAKLHDPDFTLDDVQKFEETGFASDEEAAQTMQKMINNGQGWKMQGSYGRAMMDSIENGDTMLGSSSVQDAYGNTVPSYKMVEAGSKGSPEYVANLKGEDYLRNVLGYKGKLNASALKGGAEAGAFNPNAPITPAGKTGQAGAPPDVQARLEYLRQQLNNENISYGELNELQALAKYIDPGDVQLLEAAGVPEVGQNIWSTGDGKEFNSFGEAQNHANEVLDKQNIALGIERGPFNPATAGYKSTPQFNAGEEGAFNPNASVGTNNRAVADIITGANPEGTSNNIFGKRMPDGRTAVYSYGEHFPMAIVDNETGTAVLNADKYSVTTSRHQSLVRDALEANGIKTTPGTTDAMISEIKNATPLPYNAPQGGQELSISDAKELSQKAGNHFFDADTMRFFKSKVHGDLVDNKYFITSEQMGFEPSSGRGFSIRSFDPATGDVGKVSEFNEFGSLIEARKALKAIQSGGAPAQESIYANIKEPEPAPESIYANIKEPQQPLTTDQAHELIRKQGGTIGIAKDGSKVYVPEILNNSNQEIPISDTPKGQEGFANLNAPVGGEYTTEFNKTKQGVEWIIKKNGNQVASGEVTSLGAPGQGTTLQEVAKNKAESLIDFYNQSPNLGASIPNAPVGGDEMIIPEMGLTKKAYRLLPSETQYQIKQQFPEQIAKAFGKNAPVGGGVPNIDRELAFGVTPREFQLYESAQNPNWFSSYANDPVEIAQRSGLPVEKAQIIHENWKTLSDVFDKRHGATSGFAQLNAPIGKQQVDDAFQQALDLIKEKNMPEKYMELREITAKAKMPLDEAVQKIGQIQQQMYPSANVDPTNPASIIKSQLLLDSLPEENINQYIAGMGGNPTEKAQAMVIAIARGGVDRGELLDDIISRTGLTGQLGAINPNMPVGGGAQPTPTDVWFANLQPMEQEKYLALIRQGATHAQAVEGAGLQGTFAERTYPPPNKAPNKPMWDWLDEQEGKPAGTSFANWQREIQRQGGGQGGIVAPNVNLLEPELTGAPNYMPSINWSNEATSIPEVTRALLGTIGFGAAPFVGGRIGREIGSRVKPAIQSFVNRFGGGK